MIHIKPLTFATLALLGCLCIGAQLHADDTAPGNTPAPGTPGSNPGSNPGNGPRLGGPRGPMQGGGPRNGPPGEADRPHPPLTAEQREQALEVLRDVNPDLAERITQALQDNPERARRVIQRFGPRLLELAELRKSDPVLYQLKVTDQRYNFETFKLVRQIHEARIENDDTRVERLTDRLREHLLKHFDVRMKLREHELAMLEKRIRELREELKDRHERKTQLIDQQIQTMTRDNPPPPPPPEGAPDATSDER